jgi:DNA repair protein SbcC/Rad50
VNKPLKIERLSIQGFRGIASLIDLDLSAPVTLIFAANGTGKTTVCEAAEWLLTGQIYRLRDSFDPNLLVSKFAENSKPRVQGALTIGATKRALSRTLDGARLGPEKGLLRRVNPARLMAELAPSASTDDVHPNTALNQRVNWVRGTRFLSAESLAVLVDTDEGTIARRAEIFADILGIRHLLDAERDVARYSDDLARMSRRFNDEIGELNSEATRQRAALDAPRHEATSIARELNSAERLLRIPSNVESDAQDRIEATAAELGRQQHEARQRSDNVTFVEGTFSGLRKLDDQFLAEEKIKSSLTAEQKSLAERKRALDEEIRKLEDRRRDLAAEAAVLIDAAKSIGSHLGSIRSSLSDQGTAAVTLGRLRRAAPESAWAEEAIQAQASEVRTLMRLLSGRREQEIRLQSIRTRLARATSNARSSRIEALEGQVRDAEQQHATAMRQLESTVEPFRRLQAAAQQILEHSLSDEHQCPLCRYDWHTPDRLRRAIRESLRGVPQFVGPLEAARDEADKKLSAVRQTLSAARASFAERSKLAEELAALEKETRSFDGRLKKLGVEFSSTSEISSALRQVLRRLDLAMSVARFDEEVTEKQRAFAIVRSASVSDSSSLELVARHVGRFGELASEKRSEEAACRKRLSEAGVEANKLAVQLRSVAERLDGCLARIEDLRAQRQRVLEVWRKLSRAELTRENLTKAADQARSWTERLERVAQHLAAARSAVQFETRRSELAKVETRIAKLSARRNRLSARIDAAMRGASAFRGHYARLSRQKLDALSDVVNPLFARMHANHIFDSLDLGGPENFLHWTGDAGTERLDPKTDFSQGQRQDLALALFIARARSLGGTFFLDEPVSHLDDLNRVGLLDALRSVAIENAGRLNLMITTASRALARHLIEKFAAVEPLQTQAGPVPMLRVIEMQGNPRSGLNVEYVYPRVLRTAA